MKKQAGFLFVLALGIAVFLLSEAGDLEPPGPPAPTMATLEQIYDKLGELGAGGPFRLQKTGQTSCWDDDGYAIACAGTGQDGEYQAGFAMDARFTDNRDGTVTDNLTNLIWLQDPQCVAPTHWTAALSDANTLADGACGLTDGSVPGEWRLPNPREYVSLFDYDQHIAQPPAGHPFFELQAFPGYWASTSSAAFPDLAWVVIPGGGQLDLRDKTTAYHVWPVRGAL